MDTFFSFLVPSVSDLSACVEKDHSTNGELNLPCSGIWMSDHWLFSHIFCANNIFVIHVLFTKLKKLPPPLHTNQCCPISNAAVLDHKSIFTDINICAAYCASFVIWKTPNDCIYIEELLFLRSWANLQL